MQKEENVLTILDMVSNGEISPDEGVDLLEALKASHTEKHTASPYDPRTTSQVADLRSALAVAGLPDVDFESIQLLKSFGLTPKRIQEMAEAGFGTELH